MIYMDSKIIYCIATWSGARRHMPPKYKKDSTYYLRKQIERLKKLQHSLAAIAIINPYQKKESKEFHKFLGEIENIVDPLPCFILLRRNMAMSYGSWLHAYEAFGDNFTHYLVIEDDYLPSINNFDTEMLSLMNSTNNCGVVFSCLSDIPLYESGKVSRADTFAMISNGLIAGWAFKEALPMLRTVCAEMKSKGVYDSGYQVEWTSAFSKTGVIVIDVRDKYKVEYNRHIDRVWYHSQNKTPLFEAL